MAIVIPKPTFLTDYTLKIGADNFEKAVNSILITPKVTVIEFKGGTPDATFRKVVTTGCDVAIGFVQDWESASSLSRYLQTNQATDVLAEFVPTRGAGATVKTTITLVPGPVGGNADSAATTTVTMAGSAPVFTYPTV